MGSEDVGGYGGPVGNSYVIVIIIIILFMITITIRITTVTVSLRMGMRMTVIATFVIIRHTTNNESRHQNTLQDFWVLWRPMESPEAA